MSPQITFILLLMENICFRTVCKRKLCPPPTHPVSLQYSTVVGSRTSMFSMFFGYASISRKKVRLKIAVKIIPLIHGGRGRKKKVKDH